MRQVASAGSVDQRKRSPGCSASVPGATARKAVSARENSTRSFLPSRLRNISASFQAEGKHGRNSISSPYRTNPNIDSIAARCIHAAEPVYQLQPPRPT